MSEEDEDLCECQAIFGLTMCKKDQTEDGEKRSTICGYTFGEVKKFEQLPLCWIDLTWIRSLKLARCGLKEIIFLPPNVEYVNLSYCQLTEFCLDRESTPRSLEALNLSNNKITDISLEMDIRSLICSYNKLTWIDVVGKVEYLYVDHNCGDEPLQISHETMIQHVNLNCNSDADILETLEEDGVHCQLQVVFAPSISNLSPLIDWNLFTKLSYLNLADCKLDMLEALPPNLHELYISSNNISKLPPLPPTLEVLYCCNNNLVHLDFRETMRIRKVVCYHNPLILIEIATIFEISFSLNDDLLITPVDLLKQLVENRQEKSKNQKEIEQLEDFLYRNQYTVRI